MVNNIRTLSRGWLFASGHCRPSLYTASSQNNNAHTRYYTLRLTALYLDTIAKLTFFFLPKDQGGWKKPFVNALFFIQPKLCHRYVSIFCQRKAVRLFNGFPMTRNLENGEFPNSRSSYTRAQKMWRFFEIIKRSHVQWLAIISTIVMWFVERKTLD
jgi:hypothetical protein